MTRFDLLFVMPFLR